MNITEYFSDYLSFPCMVLVSNDPIVYFLITSEYSLSLSLNSLNIAVLLPAFILT